MDRLLCHRAFCQLLGIKRAMELKRGVEGTRGAPYTAVLISRGISCGNPGSS